MPTCVDCDQWSPPSSGLSVCPACGGRLLGGEALLEAKATSLGMSVEDVRAKRRTDRETELELRRKAQAAEFAAELEAGAAAAGLTVEEYQARSRGAIEDAHLARESCFGLLFISTPAALVTGVVLLLLFVISGRSPLAAIGGTVIGALIGAVLGTLVTMAGMSDALRRFNGPILVVAWAIPPALTVVASILLLGVLP